MGAIWCKYCHSNTYLYEQFRTFVLSFIRAASSWVSFPFNRASILFLLLFIFFSFNGNVHYVNEEYNSADLSRSTNFLFCRIIIWLNHLSIKAKVTFFQLRPVLKCFYWLAISLNRCSCDRGNEQTQTVPVRSLKE